MPLTEFQTVLANTLSQNRAPDSYLAGGAAIHIEPNSARYSNDLDYFHDSAERVAQAFAEDEALLVNEGYEVDIGMSQPGFIRATVSNAKGQSKVEWAHDSAWRFMPPVQDPAVGYRLHPVDLAINKVLALVGRNEARDFLDILEMHENLLPLGALCWAAAGKDPGFTPQSLLELLRRRGHHRPEEFARLKINSLSDIDLSAVKSRWLAAIDAAETFIQSRPANEVGCLYFATSSSSFCAPANGAPVNEELRLHFGRPGGVMPRVEE